VGVQALDRLDDPRVQGPAGLLEEALVGHLVGQRVGEGVLGVGEQARLPKELGRLERRQAPTDRLLRPAGHGLEQQKGDVLPDDRRGL